MSVVHALTEAIAAKDRETYHHCRRTARFATALAVGLELGEDRISEIRDAALLHDVGKIAVPDDILHKPGLLTSREWEVMRRHSEAGAAIVAQAGMAETALWIRHLHERLDGLGYPDGLAGDEIPFESRLLHAADAFEAMTSPRPYRNAAPVEDALLALEESAGSQLDPLLAAQLAGLVRRGLLRLPKPRHIRRPTPVTSLVADASLATV